MYGIDDTSGYSNADIVRIIGLNNVDSVVECLYSDITTKTFGYYVDLRCLLPTQSIRDFSMDEIDFYCDIFKKLYWY